MKPAPLAATLLAAIAFAVISWRQSAIEDEITALRAELVRPSAPVVAEAPRVEVRAPVPAGDTAATLQKDIENIADAVNEMGAELDALQARAAAEVAARPKPSWSAAQVIGQPDTPNGGDQVTAWAAARADVGVEWLQLDYAQSVETAQVVVRETYNPGAVSKITAVLDGGSEVVLWEGRTAPGVAAPVDRPFAVRGGVTAKTIRVYIDEPRVPGWNEIDAVQLVGRDGTRQWAQGVTASSSYGGGGGRWGSGAGRSAEGLVDMFLSY